MIRTPDAPFLHRFSRPSARAAVAATAITGALLVAVGVTLPWLSFFAGLQPVSVLGTPNATPLFIGTATAAVLGTVTLLGDPRWARRGLVITGALLAGFSAYLLVGLVAVYREASADPLLVAQPGPGLIVVTAGALLVLGTAFFGD